MTTIVTTLLDTIHGGQDTPAPAEPDAGQNLFGQFTADGIAAAKCSNMDWAVQMSAGLPDAQKKLQASADQCWGDLRKQMLTGTL